MIRVIALALLSIFLLGGTTIAKYPACVKGPDQYAAFVRAVMNHDRFAIDFYLQTGCGFMKPDMPVTVLERGPFWIKIEVQPEGKPSVVLYTSPGSVKE